MASILPNGKTQFVDVNGRPLVRGKVYFYEPNTETFKDTYTDYTAATPNTNPVVLDGAGRASIWGAGSYRQVVYDWKGNLLWDDIVSDLSGPIASDDGAGLVGWAPEENRTLFISVKKALDETVDLKTKFGLTGNVGDDQTAAWNDLVDYVNGLSSAGGAARLDGCYRITGAHQALTNSLALIGTGMARSRLFFDGVDGLKIDVSRYVKEGIGALLQDISLTTNRTGFTGVSVIPPTGNADSLRFSMQRVYLCSESRWLGESQSTQPDEWTIGVDLGNLASSYKLSETHLDDLFIFGSYLNAAYATLTSSIGVRANHVTGLRLLRPNIWFQGDSGLMMRGQTEGLILQGGTIGSVKRGAVFTSLSDPSNNHIISDTHINPLTRGIVMDDPGVSTSQLISNKFSNLFILEAISSTVKAEGFIGVEAYCSNTDFSNVNVWANAAVSGTGKIAFRLGNNRNNLIGCSSHNMSYALDIKPYSTGTGPGSVRLTDFYEAGTGTGLFAPGSLYPVGTMKGSSFGEGVAATYAIAQFSYGNTDGIQWLTERPYRRTSLYTGNTSYNWDIKSSTGAATFDGRMLLSGGDASLNGRAAWSLYGASFKFAADSVGPNGDNSTSAGTASTRYSVIYAGTGSINTSDARLKTSVSSLTEAEISCAQDLAREIGWYKWLTSIEEKGAAARKHFGVTVQRAIEIFESHGLDAMTYGAICYDKWDATEPVMITSESGEEEIVSPARDGGDIYSLRWDELAAFIVRGLAAAADSLTLRVQALESQSNA